MIELIVRDATAADAQRISTIAHASWTETYRDIFGGSRAASTVTYWTSSLGTSAEWRSIGARDSW